MSRHGGSGISLQPGRVGSQLHEVWELIDRGGGHPNVGPEGLKGESSDGGLRACVIRGGHAKTTASRFDVIVVAVP